MFDVCGYSDERFFGGAEGWGEFAADDEFVDGNEFYRFYGGPAVALDQVAACGFFVFVVEEVAVCFYAGEGDCEGGFGLADEDRYLGAAVTVEG